jgi:hypothetical protein
MAPAKSVAERQREFRARKAEQAIAEVRGIFAHVDDHNTIKRHAEKVRRKREKGGTTPPASG